MPRLPGFRPKTARRSTLHTGVVQSAELLTPHMVRLVIGGPGLSEFTANGFADAYVKVVFLRPDVRYQRPLDLEQVREEHPRDEWPAQRTYTVRQWDQHTRELTLDFVVHGDEGLAGPWARSAVPGDEVFLLGPGGGYSPDPGAGWHLFAGDESALPAIAAALERLPAAARGFACIEVAGPAEEQELTVPGGVQILWVHRDGAPVGERLTDAVTALDFPRSPVHAFVHGEAGFVRDLRRLLRMERGVTADQLSISGYWRLGSDDEGWRSQKRQWNEQIEAAETAAGLL